MSKTLLSVLASSLLFGCAKIDNSKHQLQTERVVQTDNNFFSDGKLEVGVVSDIEGSKASAASTAKSLKDYDVILIAGDLYENEKIRVNPLFPNSTDNVREMVECIRPYAETKKPVFIIAGNHESQKVYSEALKILQKEFPNVQDISRRSADLHGINIVGLGGYHDLRFLPTDGVFVDSSDYKRCQKDLEELAEQNEPLILLSHSPPFSTSKIDYIPGVGNVGDKCLADIMQKKYKKQITNLHGHIHEGSNSQEFYPAGPSINVSSVTLYQNPTQKPNFSVLTFQNK